VRRIAFLALASIPVIIFALRRLSWPSQYPLLFGCCLVFLVWDCLTVLWADDRRLALRRLSSWLIVCISGFSVAQLLSFNQAVRLMMGCMLISLILGIAAEVKLRTFLLRPKYRFAGTLHPSQQGVNCAFMVLGFLYLAASGSVGFGVWVAMTVVASLFLLLTRSRSAVWAAAVSVCLWFLQQGHGFGEGTVLRRFSFWQVGLWVFAIIALGWLLVVIVSRQGIKSALLKTLLLGRLSSASRTLTGRFPLWQYALRNAAGRLLGGFGYASFWNRERVLAAFNLTGWRFSDSHSMYIETMLNTGLVGLALLVFILVLTFWESQHMASTEGALMSALTLFVSLHGIFESTFVLPNLFSFAFVLLLSSLAGGAIVRY
jgi:O-antigen ligase